MFTPRFSWNGKYIVNSKTKELYSINDWQHELGNQDTIEKLATIGDDNSGLSVEDDEEKIASVELIGANTIQDEGFMATQGNVPILKNR